MKLSVITALAGLALASPTRNKALAERGTFCGQWDSERAGRYLVYNNLWGRDSATSGSQCTTSNGVNNNVLSWSTSWSWSGGQYNVKSYPNAVVDSTRKSLSSISSIPTQWSWSYTGSNMVANVAYDLFTSSTANGSPQYEVMIWLGAFGGAGPISSTGSPIATPTIAGVRWNLWYGSHSNMNVYSFTAPSNIQSFSGDLTAFTRYLSSNRGLPASQILQSVGAGTEPFTGSNAVFRTTSYSVTVN